MDEQHPLRAWRKRHDLTQTDLGLKVGVKTSQIGMIESGKRSASLEVALAIQSLTKGAVPLQSLVRQNG